MTENNTTSCSSDMPAIVDKLGTEEQQKGLVEFMRHCSTPMTIAVQGDWGTGKTSMMRLLEKKLNDENGSTLWFPTWQFAVLGEQDRLLMDLLILLCCKLEEKCTQMKEEDKKLFHKVFRFIKRVGRASAIGGLYFAAETGKMVTGIDYTKVVDEAKGQLEKLDEEENKSDDINETNITYESYVMQVSKLHDDLTELIKAYLKLNQTERLYIFIDDLDRLEPVRAVELLEGIKNFLDIPRCVFMLAIDTKVVMEGLKAKYGENMDEDKLVHFFDKIIQIPYKLPVHNYKLKAFMEDVLKGYDEKNVDKYIKFLESADIRNPRTIKRCVSFCLLHKYMDGENVSNQKDDNVNLHLFAVKMLELEHEDVYIELLTNVRTLGENYHDIKTVVFELNEKLINRYEKSPFEKSKKKYELYNRVLQCFEIDKSEDLDRIALFAEYVIRSAPFDVALTEYIEGAKNIYNLINKIINGKKYKNIIVTSPNENNYCRTTDMSAFEIAKKIGEEKNIVFKFVFNDADVCVIYDLNNDDPLMVSISYAFFDKQILEKYCTNRLSDSIKKTEKIIYHNYGESQYIFSNIQDTSSPDAPIYKILQAACVIEIPTELTPIAP